MNLKSCQNFQNKKNEVVFCITFCITNAEMISVDKINLSQKLSLFSEYWSPKIVGDLNDSYIKLGIFFCDEGVTE